MSDKTYDLLKFISLIIIPLANFLAKCGEACGVAELATVSTILIAADVLFGAVVTAANEVYKKGHADE